MRRAPALVVAVLALALAGVAVAKAPAPPKGKFKLTGTVTGSFKVNDDKEIEKLTIVPADGDPPACGDKIKVKGALKLRTYSSGGYTAWYFGAKHKPSDGSGYRQAKVTLVVDGTTVSGKLGMIFNYDNVNRGNGDVSFGSCTHVYFNFKKSK
jgi:hypothetical protein